MKLFCICASYISNRSLKHFDGNYFFLIELIVIRCRDHYQSIFHWLVMLAVLCWHQNTVVYTHNLISARVQLSKKVREIVFFLFVYSLITLSYKEIHVHEMDSLERLANRPVISIEPWISILYVATIDIYTVISAQHNAILDICR